MSLSQQLVDEALAIYPVARASLETSAARVRGICEDMCDDLGVRARVHHRVKTQSSLRTKLARELEKSDNGQPTRFDDATTGLSVLRCVRDLIGVRVVPYREADREAIAEEIASRFDGPGGPDSAPEIRRDGEISPNPDYRAVHCQVRLRAPDGGSTDFGCEIQVVGALSHIWNELEHDIGYKPAGDQGLSQTERATLDALASHARYGDTLIEGLLTASQERAKEKHEEPAARRFRDPIDFVHSVRDAFAKGMSFARNSAQAFDALVAAGLDSQAALESTLLADADAPAKARVLVDQVNAKLAEPHLADPESADLILVLLADHLADSDAPEPLLSASGRLRRFHSALGGQRVPGHVLPEGPSAAPPDRPPARQLILEAAERLSRRGGPFTLKELLDLVIEVDPTRRRSSLAPIVQGLTINAPGGVPPAGGLRRLRRIERGTYELIDDDDADGALDTPS